MLSYSAFFLLAFLGMMVVFFQMQSQELARAENAYAQEVAWGFSDQIRTALVAGPGFAQTVQIPPSILGKPYTITVSRKISFGGGTTPPERETGFVYIDWQGPSRPAVFSAPTATTSYDVQTSGCISNPSLEFIRISSSCGQIRMENRNGTILIK